MDYLKITNSEIMEYFLNRIRNDERFENLTTSSIFGMYMEMMSGVSDLLRHYISRQAEESYFESSRLDSSAIKLSKNLFYNPQRPRPADSEISITIKGPLPQQFLRNYCKANDALKYKPTIYFNQYKTNLKYNGNNYLLKHTYSYTLSEEDIRECGNNNWSKTIKLSRDFTSKSIPLTTTVVNENLTKPIEIFQGEYRTKVFEGAYNGDNISKPYQFYDIDDVEFSNWFGDRDPHAYSVEGTVETFRPNMGYTIVGIGKNEDEAFSDENLFEINNISVYTSIGYRKAVVDGTLDQNNKLKVCTFYTNPDKTVRLKFGDNKYTVGGINSNNDNIYIKYIGTKGSLANEIGTKDCILKSEDKFYINVDGGLIDVTDNIIFKFTKDITFGADFEDSESIKNNASDYYASADRFVTKPDYEVGLRLSKALPNIHGTKVWGEGEVENMNGRLNKYLQNIVFYSIIGSPYKNDNGRYEVKNMYTDGNNFTTLYSNGITNHLVDYVKSYKSTVTFGLEQDRDSGITYMNVIKNLNSYLNLKSYMNTRCYSIPPILQYFDLVGTVYINRLTNVADFQDRLEKKIYKWLDDNVTFNKKIYLSEFYKLIQEETSDVSRCVLDLKCSGLLKGDEVTDEYQYAENDNIEKCQYLCSVSIDGSDDNQKKFIDSIVISKQQTNHTFTKYDLSNRFLDLEIRDEDDNVIFRYTGQCEVTESDLNGGDNLVLSIEKDTQDATGLNSSTEIKYGTLYLKYNNDSDYYSTSNFGGGLRSLRNYNLISSDVDKVKDILNTWIQSLNEYKGSNDTPISLPYIIDYDYGGDKNKVIYSQTMDRAGNNLYDGLQVTMSEKAFNVFFISKIVDEVYQGYNNDAGNMDMAMYSDIDWDGVNGLMKDIYPLIKPYIVTNILDDNHNITNYSMEQEIPVVRLKLNYRFV